MKPKGRKDNNQPRTFLPYEFTLLSNHTFVLLSFRVSGSKTFLHIIRHLIINVCIDIYKVLNTTLEWRLDHLICVWFYYKHDAPRKNRGKESLLSYLFPLITYLLIIIVWTSIIVYWFEMLHVYMYEFWSRVILPDREDREQTSTVTLTCLNGEVNPILSKLKSLSTVSCETSRERKC